jgi:predicted transcriptional regulator
MNKMGKIMLALHCGAHTSNEIARLVRLKRANISVALCRLADIGMVERAGVVNVGRMGRPCIRWRTRVRSNVNECSRTPRD